MGTKVVSHKVGDVWLLHLVDALADYDTIPRGRLYSLQESTTTTGPWMIPFCDLGKLSSTPYFRFVLLQPGPLRTIHMFMRAAAAASHEYRD